MNWINDKLRLHCVQCHREFPWSFVPQCPDCKTAMVDVDYNLANVRIKPEGPPMERYFDLLPMLSRDNIIDGGEGNTPCVHTKELGRALGGLTNLYGKIESANPTKTTKDRQGTQAVATFRDFGIKKFVTSSTGNSCTSLARIVSRFSDMHMCIFVGDEFIERVNWVGAPNVTVYWLPNGSFVDAQHASKWFCDQNREYVSERGFFFIGKREALKAAYMEAVDQIPAPIEYYFQGISSAMGVYSTYKASQQLLGLGRINRIPGIVCVQEETCNPIVKSWDRGAEQFDLRDIVEMPRGLSKATLRGDPRLAYGYVRNAVVDSGGTMLTARQDDMRAMKALAMETEGLDICHTSAMTLVAARDLAASGWLRRDAVIMLNLTGADRTGEPYPKPDFLVHKEGDGWRVEPAQGAKSEGAFDRVRRVLVTSARLDHTVDVTTDTRLVKGGLGLDSVAILEFSLALEREFEIEVSEKDLIPENFSTLGLVADMVRSKLASASLAAD